MNKHINLVKKWLVEPESVTQQELDDNLTAATKQYYADATNATYAAVFYAATYAAKAVDYDVASTAYFAKYWVEQYEELEEQGDE
jgi:hypothetical protein